jgi:multidrug transporter EmrE-like cation transporter
MYLLISFGAAIAFTIGGICMKLSQGLSYFIPSLGVYTFFCLGATLQTMAMRNQELGITYIFILALESVMAFCFGIWFFKEDQTLLKLFGISLIVAGITMLRAGNS